MTVNGNKKEKKVTAVNQNELTGTVLSVHKTGYDVNVNGKPHFCITNNSFKADSKPVVNDSVTLEKSSDQYIITNILKRKNFIARYDFYKEAEQGFAANIDTLFVVTSANREFNVNRITRFLAIAGDQDIRKVIVLTKIDLTKDTKPYLNKLKSKFGNAEHILLNATLKSDVDKLLAYIPKEGTALLTGSSGVGKSTTINSLCALNLKTRAVQDERLGNKGKHTTSARTLYFLADGRKIIDMPGVRIVGVEKHTADNSPIFAHIADLAQQCKYTNCKHLTEDNCAVLNAVKNGTLKTDELERYREITENTQRVTRKK